MRSHIHQYTGRSLHHATLNSQSPPATLRDRSAQGSVQQFGLHWRKPVERDHQACTEQCDVFITQSAACLLTNNFRFKTLFCCKSFVFYRNILRTELHCMHCVEVYKAILSSPLYTAHIKSRITTF